MRSDNFKPTNISRILYVELLTSDGYLVERQQLALDENSTAYGQFVIRDSLYSGYYELRLSLQKPLYYLFQKQVSLNNSVPSYLVLTELINCQGNKGADSILCNGICP
jgi:uncharacterized protein YfaS (alpha-2-macroglobulin family)